MLRRSAIEANSFVLLEVYEGIFIHAVRAALYRKQSKTCPLSRSMLLYLRFQADLSPTCVNCGPQRC